MTVLGPYMYNRPIHEYGVIILGGGCAGLSLVRKLVQHNFDTPILLLEGRAQYTHDRTWSGWFSAKQLQGLETIPKHTYTSWSFTSDSRKILHTSNEHAYFSIASGDFYTDTLELLKQSPMVDVHLGIALGENDITHLIANKSEQTILIDTIGVTQKPHKRKVSTSTTYQQSHSSGLSTDREGLWQRFVGVTVSANQPLFAQDELKQAALMHDMQSNEHGFCFNYILPLTQYTALVETTYFTTDALSSTYLQQQSIVAAKNYFAPNTDVNNARHHAFALTFTISEEGHLPMQVSPDNASKTFSSTKDIILGGTIAGALRPSSGYGFASIQDWANKVAEFLISENSQVCEPYQHYSSTTLYLDRIFLAALSRYSAIAPQLFLAMATTLSAKQFALFMNHQAGLLVWLKVIWAMPKRFFIKAWWGIGRKKDTLNAE